MLVLVVVAIGCFAAGVTAAARWLPDLAAGTVGALAFFVICGLCGAVVALFGLNIDVMIKEAEQARESFATTIVANGLIDIARDCGALAAFALIAFLLAPRTREDDDASA